MCTGSIRQGGGALEDIVSITSLGEPRQKITVASLREKKLQHQPITCLTAYDYASARLVDEANIDILLVGDSLAMTMLGYPDTLSVTVDEMLHHTKAVRRGVKHALLVADMPYGSYHVGADDALRNAARFVKEAGTEVVKIEGGEKRADLIRRVIDAEIPVAGHIGLTPQSVNVMGGYKVQGKSLAEIEQLMRDAVALDRAGVAFLVLEGIPREVASMITAEVATPTIGIGAGPECDGQVLVFHDILNLTFTPPAKFVRRYGDAAALITDAAHAFREDVIAHQYPADSESYHLSKETRQALETVLERKRSMRR
jgi:3-methyl-2-oxobutanoate hydroxymethyltransferase